MSKRAVIAGIGRTAYSRRSGRSGAGGHPDQWPDMTRLYSAHVAPRLWEKARLSPSDIDVACLEGGDFAAPVFEVVDE